MIVYMVLYYLHDIKVKKLIIRTIIQELNK